MVTGDFVSGDNLIDVKYGTIQIAKLMGKSNKIVTSYGGSVSIDETNKMNIDIKYSNLKIGSADELYIQSGYTNTPIQQSARQIKLKPNRNMKIIKLEK